MLNFVTHLKAAAAKRALYNKTRREIAELPRAIAFDLGIFPEDADRLARDAVYGN